MKNYIMISGDNKKHLSKASQIPATIMLNLEDGVAKENKKEALKNIIEFLSKKSFKQKVIVRVNELDKGGIEEIKELNRFKVGIRIPKINYMGELNKVFDLTNNEIHLSVETKEMFLNLKEFKLPQIKGFYLGILDLFDELKLSHNLINFDNQMIHKLLIDFSLNCRYLDIKGIGFVYQKYKDLEGFKKWCEIQKQYGIEGVGCITPNQIEIANQIFIKEDLEYAKMIVERFEKEGVFTLNGLYVDEPIYKNYKMLLNK